MWLLLAGIHQLALVSLAALASWLLGPEAASVTSVPAGGDEIYSRLVLGMIGSAQPRGFEPAADVVFAAGSSAVGVQLLLVLVNLAMAAAGAGLLVAAWGRPGRWIGRTAAGLCLAFSAGAELGLSWGAGSGGEMALSMVATKILGIDSGLYAAALAGDWLLSLAINLLFLAVAAGAGAGLGLLALRLRPPRRELLRLRLARLMARPRTALLPGTALVLALAATPLQPSVRFEDSQAVAVVTIPAIEPAPELAEPAPLEAVPMPEAVQPPRQRVAESPSVVAIAARPDGSFEYRVNGRAEFIRGVGYNPITKTASPEQRAARFDRDFAAMSAIGVNTVSGWDEGEFDELLLDKAAEYGLGVILPFELRPAWAYDDPKVRQQVRDEVLKRAQRFKDRPALRMWALGNEVIHGILPRNGPRAQAFSQFLIQAADELHNLDASHPIVYRDAEDVFLEPVARALRANPQPRPWFVYGMNFFTTRMDDALTKGPARSLRQPLLISEFAPAGLRAADRPTGYSKLWGVIQAHRSMLLGGCAYVWSTAGPEPLDRSFGLTNEAGEPVDSTVAALASLFTASASP